MKKYILLITLIFLPGILALSAAGLEDKSIGLGFVIGEPTGISFKKWTGRLKAIDGLVAWSFEKESRFVVHFGLLKHNFDEFEIKQGKMPFYYGGGVRLKVMENDSRIGARAVVGMGYIFKTEPLEIFLEFGPVLDIIPSIEVDVTAGLGIRYYFK